MKYKLKNTFNNRNILYFVLCIVMISIFSLTIVYAALNTILRINGNAEVVASSWDIYLDNIQIVSGSVSSNEPTIIDKTMASFTTTLTNPGDYYMFTVDVVNKGSIDAMIDGIVKTPTLSESQAKYLNYIVEYQNGESISTKQLVEAGSFVKLKVKVEFRKDLVASDLPTTTETLNLSFKVNYVQAEETGTSNVQNNGKLVRIVNGDYDTVGSEVCIDTECFYVISSDETSVTMLAKYNLLVGNRYDSTNGAIPLENSTGVQDESAVGYIYDSSNRVEKYPFIGVTPFSSDVKKGDNYSDYDGSLVEEYVNDYENYLLTLGVLPVESRIITYDELIKLGCSITDEVERNGSCASAPSFVYSTSYWTKSSRSSYSLWYVNNIAYIGGYVNSINYLGVRPVITIPKDL